MALRPCDGEGRRREVKVKDLIAHLVEMDAGDAEVCVSVTNCFSAFTAAFEEIFCYSHRSQEEGGSFIP